ncbi:retrotransposon protein, putative, ty1-copia subclass [Tanacetum coccineum]
MYDNQVWNLVDTTPGLKTVGCKWIFKKKKTDIDGKVHTYKARWLSRPLSLSEKTNEECLCTTEGFENAKYPKELQHSKANYGLKQASRSWNLCFHEKVTHFGFSRSEDESHIYFKVSGTVKNILKDLDILRYVLSLWLENEELSGVMKSSSKITSGSIPHVIASFKLVRLQMKLST